MRQKLAFKYRFWRQWSLGVLLSTALWYDNVGAQEEKNLFFSDVLIWKRAAGLAQALTSELFPPTLNISDSLRSDYRDQFEILYHHHLIACAGPLREIAALLKVDAETRTLEPQITNNPLIVNETAAAIDEIIAKWQRHIKLPLIKDFQSAKYGFFPNCIDPTFRKQNPHLQLPKE